MLLDDRALADEAQDHLRQCVAPVNRAGQEVNQPRPRDDERTDSARDRSRSPEISIGCAELYCVDRASLTLCGDDLVRREFCTADRQAHSLAADWFQRRGGVADRDLPVGPG